MSGSATGFEQKKESGLYVPERLAKPVREMAPDDRKQMLRAIAMLKQNYDVDVWLRCAVKDCPAPTLEAKDVEDGVQFACGCRALVIKNIEGMRMSARTRTRRGL
jgi:hypothetical protein